LRFLRKEVVYSGSLLALNRAERILLALQDSRKFNHVDGSLSEPFLNKIMDFGETLLISVEYLVYGRTG
jgi:hypothetical protein